MKVIDRLWRPSAKEASSGTVLQSRYSLLSGTTSAVAGTVTFTSPVTPANTLRILSAFGGNALGGAASVVQRGVVTTFLASGAAFFTWGFEPFYVPAAATQFFFGFNLGDGVALKNGEYWTLQFFFSSGAVSNAFNVTAYGYDMPVGNVQ